MSYHARGRHRQLPRMKTQMGTLQGLQSQATRLLEFIDLSIRLRFSCSTNAATKREQAHCLAPSGQMLALLVFILQGVEVQHVYSGQLIPPRVAKFFRSVATRGNPEETTRRKTDRQEPRAGLVSKTASSCIILHKFIQTTPRNHSKTRSS